MALDRCVAMPADAFRADVYGVRHLHTPAGDLPAGFADLLTSQSLDELFTGGALRTTSVRLVRDGREVPTRGVVEPGDVPAEPSFVDADHLRRALAAGNTLILRSLHRYHPPVRRLAHQLAGELGCAVRVNAFVTPPRSTGVDLHYDVQDVFVLQIAGSKLWRLGTPPLPAPLPSQAWFDLPAARREQLRAASEPLGSVLLRAGDTLYLPRGTMHAPRTDDELSIHLTIAVSRLTGHDLLRRLVDAAADDAALRAGVDLAELEADPDTARTTLTWIARRLAATADEVDVAGLLWSARREAFRDLPAEPAPVLPAPVDAPAYRLRPGAQYAATPDGDTLRLRVPGKQATLPVTTAPVFDALRRHGHLDPRELTATFGDDDASRLITLLVDLDLVAPVVGARAERSATA
ncbi:hypothetical protein O7606_18235 [Micromonospora sp. WMMD882]|uniref:JmjC domain-containing protein n=1 Tax=Micromonospora sp. WMMD882 TaxID=3015151 RepID=UPI00248AE794|nr:cupin domain-containing protein [Micromonospora sp. WMMD882]WBB78169.1 hypothetical protein O7606_18235 [Micromonospora sp. WMMD882]